jgi:hypothetical protein
MEKIELKTDLRAKALLMLNDEDFFTEFSLGKEPICLNDSENEGRAFYTDHNNGWLKSEDVHITYESIKNNEKWIPKTAKFLERIIKTAWEEYTDFLLKT